MKPDSIRNSIGILLQLSKVKITVAVSLTTFTGYILAGGKFNLGFIPVTLGIFLLACAASVMNHIQEQRTDALMQRTHNRPLPSGKVSTQWALVLFVSELITGILILIYSGNILALYLGFTALIWYNLIYTYLKRITPHAVIPGSVIGAIPPLAGWVAAGGSLVDLHAWTMALFFFMWQVPHFYLLVMKYGQQYQKAGMPSLTGKYDDRMIRLMIFLWIVATGLSALLLFYFELVYSLVGLVIITLASLLIIGVFLIPLIRRDIIFRPFRYFMRINYYVLVVVVMLVMDRFFVLYLA